MASGSDDRPEGFSKSDDLLEILRRGRTFAEELLRENERLRLKVVQLEHAQATGERDDAHEALRAENALLRERLAGVERRFSEVEGINSDFDKRFREIERQNEALANLYVASYQLHSTLDLDEVVGAISEIVTGLVGAEEYALLLLHDETSRLDVVAGDEVEHRFPNGHIGLDEGLEGRVAASGQPFFGEPGSEHDQYAFVPLMLMSRCVGIICIYRMLPQKRAGLTAVDHELLNLLAGQAAAALVSARLYAFGDGARAS